MPPSGDCTLEALLVIILFGLVHLPKQLHSIFFSQGGKLLPLPAPKNRLVKALSLIILNNITFNVFAINAKNQMTRTEKFKGVSVLIGQGKARLCYVITS